MLSHVWSTGEKKVPSSSSKLLPGCQIKGGGGVSLLDCMSKDGNLPTKPGPKKIFTSFKIVFYSFTYI